MTQDVIRRGGIIWANQRYRKSVNQSTYRLANKTCCAATTSRVVIVALSCSQGQIRAIERQVDALRTRILDATGTTAIRTYADKISDLERTKAIVTDAMQNHTEAMGSFDTHLELALQLLASPWKI